jgi:peptidoglycan-N-acetylglucosamine deacetylase
MQLADGTPGFPTRVVRRLRTRLLGTVVGVRTNEQIAALTFDDGPDPDDTPPVLDILARHGARATFFLVGERAARYPEIVARIRAEGHAVGNHSWDHPSLPRLTGRAIVEQLRRTEAVLGRSRLMRPPYGDQSLASYLHSRRLGHTVVTWSAVGLDWTDVPTAEIEARLVAGLGPGAILLLHDTLHSYIEERYRDRRPMRAALDGLLAARPDWGFVTLPDLLAAGRPRWRYWIQPTNTELQDTLIYSTYPGQNPVA